MKTARSLLFVTTALASLLSAAASRATTFYTWEDESGIVHFSDQPQPGASVVALDELPVATPFPGATPPAELSDTADVESPLPPATIRLQAPGDQQTLRNNEGIINVTAVTNRELNQGHTVRLLLDGAPYGRPQTQSNWHLVNIDRGSHTLQAQIFKYGKVIASSEVITVYLHRASRLQRKSPAVIPK